MTDGEAQSPAVTDAPLRWTAELDRLARLLQELLSENARLDGENRELRAIASAASGRRDTRQLAAVRRQLADDRQRWERQRQLIADRIEVILGKFQWLERERAGRSAPVADA